jgi:outer membrane protein assembly factor BamB
MTTLQAIRSTTNLAVAGALWVGPTAYGADWARWRGPEGTGISLETQWNPKALEGGAKIAWQADIGMGYASFSVAGGRAYMMGNRNDEDIVLCLDAKDGGEIWRHAYACKAQGHGGTRATPVVDVGRVYTLSRDGQAFCLDAATGAVVWRRNIVSEESLPVPTWGLAGSPLVLGEKVFLNAGRHGMALDKATGKTLWVSDKENSGYSTPVPFRLGDRDFLAVFGAKAVYGVDPATGAVAWQYPWETAYDVNATDPIFHEGRLFISSGYDRGCALLDLTGDSPRSVWENKTIRGQFSTAVLRDGYLYGLDGNTGKGILRCIEWETGGEKWAADIGFGSLILAGDKLIVLNERGVLTIAEASPKAFDKVSSAQIVDGRDFWTPPAFADGRLYVRNHEGTAVCVDLR